MMKQLAIFCALFVVATSAGAAGGGVELLESNASLRSKAALQRGARTFVNYCLSCHSAKYMRYNRMADDLELDIESVEDNLMFTTDKVGDTMNIAMDPADAEVWFGVTPPDLSVIARSRGADWLYSFLMGFYLDDSRPTGVNNTYFADTAMPHVLGTLQGFRKKVEASDTDDGHGSHGPTYETVVTGSQSEAEYEQTVRELVSFLVYMGEPAKLVRYRVGFWVIAFLFVLLGATYLMKREYWKDVH